MNQSTAPYGSCGMAACEKTIQQLTAERDALAMRHILPRLDTHAQRMSNNNHWGYR